MASKTKPFKSARQAAVEVLARAGQPLSGSEIARRVIQTDGVSLQGKTPDATVMAVLVRENKKPDGLFVRTSPGVYALREEVRRALTSER